MCENIVVTPELLMMLSANIQLEYLLFKHCYSISIVITIILFNEND